MRHFAGSPRRFAVATGVTLLALLAALLTAPSAASAAPAQSAAARSVGSHALSGSSFNRGLIISDSLFYDGNAMNQAQIQSFLNARIGTCSNGKCLNVLSVSAASQPAYVSDATGRTACVAITGGKMSVASWIFRVQQACGISARVILVTLQKEQGLVTSRAPSDYALTYAMGMNCPDTTGCSSSAGGLASQIYRGTRQLKIYKSSAFGRQPGVHTIPYSTRSSCGGVSIRIQNYATAALYNYTPYTPNAAALANLGGVGDACSSYGNRNFWYYFSSWFGNPLAGAGDAAISEAYESAGAADGPLGVLPPSSCGNAVQCFVASSSAGVFWTAALGAHSVEGAIFEKYLESGGPSGPLGWPTVDSDVQPGRTGDGRAQSFENGSIYSGPDGAYVVLQSTRATYQAALSTRGQFGWPTTDTVSVNANKLVGAYQTFEGGAIANSSLGIATVPAEILGRYGGPSGALGWPRVDGAAQGGGAFGDGMAQSFQNGSIYAGPEGAFAVSGPIRSAFWRLKSTAGWLGWPVGAAACAGSACTQAFDGGTIVFRSGASAAYGVPSAIWEAYQALGGPSGALGWPRVDGAAQGGGAFGDGMAQSFQNGSIYAGPEGAFAVSGPIRSAFWKAGSTNGPYGWPVAGQACDTSGCSQQFQGGTVVDHR